MDSIRKTLLFLKNLINNPFAVALGTFTAVSYLLFAVWFPMRSFLWFTITKSGFSASGKIRILVASLKGLETNFTTPSRILLIISALLTGLTIAAITLYLRRRGDLERSAGTSAMGILTSVMGIGCASCGSIILTSLFGIGALSFTAALPLNGIEFNILGILLLLYSLVSIAKKDADPLSCKTKNL